MRTFLEQSQEILTRKICDGKHCFIQIALILATLIDKNLSAKTKKNSRDY